MIIYGYGGFHKLGVPQNRWFIIMESPMKIDDLGVPLFQEIHVYIYIHGKIKHMATKPASRYIIWVKTRINHPPVITIFVGGMVTIPKWVVDGIVLTTVVPMLPAIEHDHHFGGTLPFQRP